MYKVQLTGYPKTPFTLSLSKGRSWFDKLTTNGFGAFLDALPSDNRRVYRYSVTAMTTGRFPTLP